MYFEYTERENWKVGVCVCVCVEREREGLICV